MEDSIIKVNGLGKKYIIAHEGRERYTALRDVITRSAKKIAGAKKFIRRSKEEFWALKDVGFELKRGEALGIIGRNGAGKSTLLKILSRVTEPTTGRIEINGRIASLLEVGTGFHPELTGRENIFLNGAILGMSRAEIRRKFEEIVDFSGVEKFLDTPVKRYSSGMYVRLAFSVAAHMEPEILVVDEVLAVGDAEFQKKCLGKMGAVSKSEGRTILFVSHDMSAISQICSRGMLLTNGQVQLLGSMDDVIVEYLSAIKSNSEFVQGAEKNKPAYFKRIFVTDKDGRARTEFKIDEPVCIDFEVEIKNPAFKCDIFVLVLDSKKRKIFAAETPLVKKNNRLIIEPSFLVRGDYSIHTFINVPMIEQVDVVAECCPFTVIDNGSLMAKHSIYDYGCILGRYVWE